MQEFVGLLVVLIVWACAACDSALLRAALCVMAIALFVGISSHSTRASFVSARKAAADRLPQTSNPHHNATTGAEKKKESTHSSTTEDNLPQTVNPQKRDGARNDANKAAVATSMPRGSINDVAYTFEGQRAKLDERIFRPEPQRQSSESRARMLDAMYRELVDSSQKSDPAMREIGSDGCDIMRGRAEPRAV